jgi:hypothetical protein
VRASTRPLGRDLRKRSSSSFKITRQPGQEHPDGAISPQSDLPRPAGYISHHRLQSFPFPDYSPHSDLLLPGLGYDTFIAPEQHVYQVRAGHMDKVIALRQNQL